MLTDGMSRQSMYDIVWMTTDAVNKTKSFDFNADGAEFPSHAEQDIIVQCFKDRGSVEFDQINLAFDGKLIWMVKSFGADCEVMRVREKNSLLFWR